MRRFLALAALSIVVSVALTTVAFLVTRSGRLHLPDAALADESIAEVPE